MTRSRGTTAWTAVGLSLLLVVCPAAARAQTDDGDHVRFSITPYAWLSDLHGTAGLGQVRANIDLSAADVLSALSFGIMGSAEIQRGSWLFAADGIHTSFDGAHTFANRHDPGSPALWQRETIIQPVIGYSLGDALASFEVLGGVRFWNLSTSLGTDASALPLEDGAMSQRWADATGGFRIRIVPERVRLLAGADAGGGGSHSTWQWYASIGYDFWPKVSLDVAYRMRDVNYDRHDFLYDMRSSGVVLGATFRP